MFLRNSLTRFHIEWFKRASEVVFVCLTTSSSISEELLASEKEFEQFFFHITGY